MKRALFILILSFFASSCEKEEHSIIYDAEDNIVADESLRSNLLRITQNATAVDNIIDGSSCFSIKFPYTVTANGTVVVLNSEADYEIIINLLDASVTDYDEVTLQYPITVIYADYTEVELTSETDLNNAKSNCEESIELSCMGFVYPVGVKTYLSYNQAAESFNISNKKGLYGFLKEIDNYDVVTFNYPGVFGTPNGDVTLQNNTMLREVISTYTDDCVQSLNLPPVFEDTIVQGTWYVSYYYMDADQTANFSGYNFTFNTDGSIAVSGSTTTSGGMWDKSPDDLDPMVLLVFSDSLLDSLSGVWRINRVSENLIQLRIPASGVMGATYFNLSRN